MAARFGEIAVSMGYVSASQIMSALTKQNELRKQGIRKCIGDILLEENVINKAEFERIIARCRLIQHVSLRR